MAQLALGIVGGMIAGPIGFALGTAAGSYIDSEYLFPAVFGTDEQQEQPIMLHGQRLNEIQVQATSEGSPVQFALGEQNRIAGTIIWLSELHETSLATPRPTRPWGITTTYTYQVDIAIAVCEGEIESFDKVWANGQVIWQPEQTVNKISNLVSVESSSVLGQYTMKVISENGGPDLKEYKSGLDIAFSGWTNGANNGTGTVIEVGDGPGAGETFMQVRKDTWLDEVFGATVTMNQTIPAFSESMMEGIEFYTGTLTQTPDPTIQAIEGVDEVPPFRGIAYVVIKNLEIKQFGNVLPHFQFLVNEQTDRKVNEAIPIILERYGLTADQYDVSGVEDTEILKGMAVQGPQSGQDLINPLITAHDLVLTESEGKFIFKSRGNVDVVTVDENDLATREFGAAAAGKIGETDGMSIDLPNEVNVRFIEKKMDWQMSMQRERRFATPSEQVVNYDLPMVLTGAEARKIARRELWQAWAGRRVYSMSLPVSYLEIQPNDTLAMTVNDEDLRMTVKRVDRGANDILAIEAVKEYDAANEQVGVEDEVEDLSLTYHIFVAGELFFCVIDIAPFTNNEVSTPGIYYSIGKYDPEADWLSSAIWQSGDGQNFYLVGNQIVEGWAGEVIGDRFPSNSTYLWDRESTVRIRMREGTLESKTELEVLNGANRAVIGGEVIGYANATLVDTDTYDLDTFLRGLRGTESQVANHDIDSERFIPINDNPGFEFLPTNLADTDRDQDFKAQAPGVLLGTIPAYKLQPMRNNTIQCFAPAVLTGLRDSSNNLTISWKRRSRTLHKVLLQVAPMLEARERYEIDILDTPGGNVLRTIEVEDATSVVYTAAQQTTDGFAPGNPIPIDIYQLSDLVGRGTGREVTL